ncbi:uncharacterized protein LOC114195577 [Vigna unguiculata]|uniref:Uncharacterized protein n=1 Tax=Vigna unguiculata TaxID=3917 RepID=A0A4D6MG84_VIGUN|nr:uncharacterized protein LOC114195577 [Vigna unguiculata]QCE00396.1 hypothetical protein DEO72_LG7g1686 [Vigna unguiculata]
MSSENHHYFYHQNLQIHRRTTFLPMLCARPSSMKDVSLPQWRDQTGSFSNDPLSPRIGCMGQVKRHNKIVGILSTKSSTTTNVISPTVKYSKLKKLFSGKNLGTTNTNTNVTANVSRNHNKQRCTRNENVVPISIENMDLPLPVIKRVQKKPEEDTLWKRRSGGAALKTLQLQQIHRSRHHPQLTSV